MRRARRLQTDTTEKIRALQDAVESLEKAQRATAKLADEHEEKLKEISNQVLSRFQ